MKKLLSVFVGILSATSLFASDYAVKKIGGVPTIVMDGKPVNARMLYVNQNGSMPVQLSDQWKEISSTFTSTENSKNSAIHFRYATINRKFFIKKIEITNLTTGKVLKTLDTQSEKPNLRFWCAGIYRTKNLDVSIKNVEENGERFTLIKTGAFDPNLDGFHLLFDGITINKGETYKIVVVVKTDAKSTLLKSEFRAQDLNYKVLTSFSVGNPLDIQTKLASDIGVDFVTLPIIVSWTDADKEKVFADIKNAYDRLIKVNPNVKIIPRIRFYPSEEWKRLHPDDMMKYSDGKIENNFTSIASENYRQACLRALRELIEFSEKNYAKNMAGYHPTGGNTHEWFYGNTWKPQYSGYDKQTLKAWRKWLVEKYSTDSALQQAWNNQSVKLESAEVPTAERRANCGDIIDPQMYQDVIDFNIFLQDDMVSIIKLLSDEVRKLVPNRLVVIFYGYGCEFSSVMNGPAFSGHYGLQKLLKCDSIDILCGPISYFDRSLGEGKTVMGAAETIMRAGKLWLDEDDTSTYLAGKGAYPGSERGLDTQEKTVKVLQRNLAQQLIRNFANWYMDLGGAGWFSDKKFWDEMAKVNAEESKRWKKPKEYRPQVAFIFDELSMCYIGGNSASKKTTAVLLSETRKQLNRASVPFGHYLAEDIINKRRASKLNVFAGVFALDNNARAKLRKRANKAVNIWAWLPGYVDVDNRKFSTSTVKELTNFDVEVMPKGTMSIAVATPTGLQIGLPNHIKGLVRDIVLLSPKIQDGDLVLATFNNGKPAIVQRGKDIFCAIPMIDSALIRYASKLAGVHIYSEKPLTVYRSGKYISIVAHSPDNYSVDLGGNYKVYDVYAQKELGEHSVLDLQMQTADIKLLRLEKTE